jgi:hypothetical protein
MYVSPRIRVDICDAIELMVQVLGSARERVLLVSSVGTDGYVGPGECLLLDKGLPSPEVLFELARRVGALCLLFGSPATHSVFEPDEQDVALFRHLLHACDVAKIPLVEYVLVKGCSFRLMRETDGLEPLF